MAARVLARRRELGITRADDLRLRNTGRRRTAAKRALLEKIERAARERGLPPW